MKKGLEIFLNILKTLVAVPFGIMGAVCLIPLAAIGLLIEIPSLIISDIWNINHKED